MKKVFAILAILSLLMVPCVSMAATMSDADLAAVTGQSGDMRVGTFTYGDLDGFTGTNSLGNDFTNPGYINLAFFPVPTHFGIGDIKLVIDIGTSVTTSVTAVNIAGSMSSPITADTIMFNLDLIPDNGAAVDYATNAAIGSSYGPAFSPAYYTQSNANLSYNIGVVGLSNISITVPTFNIAISAH